MPQCTPAQCWTDPHTDSASFLVIKQMDLQITRCNITLTLIGLIPGLWGSWQEVLAKMVNQIWRLPDGMKDQRHILEDGSWQSRNEVVHHASGMNCSLWVLHHPEFDGLHDKCDLLLYQHPPIQAPM